MNIRLHISRDFRDGLPLRVKRDGYRYECPDIPVDVDVEPEGDDWRIEDAKIAEDVPGMCETVRNGQCFAVTTDDFLFRAEDEIALTGDEEEEAVAEYLRSARGLFDG